MKALDTPVLLSVLRDRAKVRALLTSMAGHELATTEVNLLELELLARADASRGLEKRLAALERLRRRLTVLPIDERATRAASALARSAPRTTSPNVLLMLGAIEAASCSEWVTNRHGAELGVRGKVKVRVFSE